MPPCSSAGLEMLRVCGRPRRKSAAELPVKMPLKVKPPWLWNQVRLRYWPRRYSPPNLKLWPPRIQLRESVRSRVSLVREDGAAEVLPTSKRLETLISEGFGGPNSGRVEPRLCRL